MPRPSRSLDATRRPLDAMPVDIEYDREPGSRRCARTLPRQFSPRDGWTTVRRRPLGREPSEKCPLPGRRGGPEAATSASESPLVCAEPISVTAVVWQPGAHRVIHRARRRCSIRILLRSARGHGPLAMQSRPAAELLTRVLHRMRRRCCVARFVCPRLVLSWCAKSAPPLLLAMLRTGVPGVPGIRIPRCSARAHRADRHRVRGPVLSCSPSAPTSARAMLPEGVRHVLRAPLPGAPPVLTKPLVGTSGCGCPMEALLLRRADRRGAASRCTSRFVRASCGAPRVVRRLLSDAQRLMRQWFLGCPSSALSDGRLVLRRCSAIGTQHGSYRAPPMRQEVMVSDWEPGAKRRAR
jgi:hypothetical protein